MNEEIYSIIEDMKAKCPKDPTQRPDIHQVYQSVQMARLLVLLAEESERQSNKITEQTEKMINWTKAIVALTIALFFVGAIQIVMMIVKS
jgi:hypothetical protein